MSRILLWSPNYAPELTGIPPLVTDAAEWLAARGHRIDVVAPLPNYPERRIHAGYRGRLWMSERRGDVDVHRSWLRVRPEEGVIDKMLYEATASTMALPPVIRRLGSADVLICVVPTLLAAVYATLLPRRPRVVLWVQDRVTLGAAALELSPGVTRVLRGVGRLERRAVARADRVIVCSPGFRDHFVEHGSDSTKIDVVYNWADLDWIAATPTPEPNGRLRVLYAGNLGYSQGFETIVEAARLAGDQVSVDIVGDGNASRTVAQLAESVPNVTVRGPVARSEYPSLLASHDAHVVLQRRVSAGANLPSKIATYLASGRPVVASIDGGTPAAELLRESGGALLVEPESPEALADAMVRLRQDGDLGRDLAGRGRAFAEARLGKDVALRRIEALALGTSP